MAICYSYEFLPQFHTQTSILFASDASVYYGIRSETIARTPQYVTVNCMHIELCKHTARWRYLPKLTTSFEDDIRQIK